MTVDVIPVLPGTVLEDQSTPVGAFWLVSGTVL